MKFEHGFHILLNTMFKNLPFWSSLTQHFFKIYGWISG